MVSHQKLIVSLGNLGSCGYSFLRSFLACLIDYLDGRTQQVWINECFSTAVTFLLVCLKKTFEFYFLIMPFYVYANFIRMRMTANSLGALLSLTTRTAYFKRTSVLTVCGVVNCSLKFSSISFSF